MTTIAKAIPGSGSYSSHLQHSRTVMPKARIVLFANTDWYLFNFRLSLALALKERGYDLLLLSPPGPHGERLRSMGLRWEPVPMHRRSLNPLREILLLVRLWHTIGSYKADLVHGFTIKCALYGSVVGRLSGCARVSAITGMGYVFTSEDKMARVLRPLVRAFLRLALGGKRSRVILQNPDDVALVKRAGIADTETIRLIPGSGVDCSRFADRLPKNGAGPKKVLFAARVLWDKGISEFVAAARRLRAQGRHLRFLVAGTPDLGNPATVPESRLLEWVNEGAVEWLGHVGDMAALLQAVDMMVLPSYREGLPKGLIEAAACGLPLVTTNVPGCREVVTDGVDGLLVPARDAEALADAIGKLDDAPELAARLGRAARAKALRMFDERIVVDSTIAVYDELLDTP